MSNNERDWQAIGEALRAPFPVAEVDFRPIGKTSDSGKSQVACYIDARTVANRLDDVVGPGGWSFTYTPLVIEKGDIQIAKGALTIHGITKEDVGDASNQDASKGCVSDALKRAAVLWGIGRYLYDVGSEWVTLDQYKRISAADVQRLRARLPRPEGAQPAATPAATPAPEMNGPASADQRERMRKYRDALHILDNSIAKTDDSLNYSAAEARISSYIEQWKKTQAGTQKAGAAR